MDKNTRLADKLDLGDLEEQVVPSAAGDGPAVAIIVLIYHLIVKQ